MFSTSPEAAPKTGGVADPLPNVKAVDEVLEGSLNANAPVGAIALSAAPPPKRGAVGLGACDPNENVDAAGAEASPGAMVPLVAPKRLDAAGIGAPACWSRVALARSAPEPPDVNAPLETLDAGAAVPNKEGAPADALPKVNAGLPAAAGAVGIGAVAEAPNENTPDVAAGLSRAASSTSFAAGAAPKLNEVEPHAGAENENTPGVAEAWEVNSDVGAAED